MRNKESKRSAYGKAKRVLSKVRDFYVKSMMDFDGKFAHHSNMIMACPAAHPQAPPNFGADAIKTKREESIKELYRTISMKNIYTAAETFMDRKERIDRSYSVGVGRIGTIDEDEPCEFIEDEITTKTETLFPRSRSCNIVKRN